MELYITVEWAKLCAEVAKLRLDRRSGGKVLPLHTHVEHAPGDGEQASRAQGPTARE